MSLTSYKFHLFEFRFNYEAVCRLDDVLFICWKKGVEWSYLQRMIQISIVELILRSCKSEETILKKVRTAAKKTWVVSCRGCVPTCWQFTIALSGVWKKFLSQHLLSKLWWSARLDAALMTWRRLGDLVGGDLATASFPREECSSSGCSAKSRCSSALLQRKP